MRLGQQGRKPTKTIIYQGQEMLLTTFASISPYVRWLTYKLADEGLTGEEIIARREPALNTKLMRHYGRTRQWVLNKRKEGYVPVEKDGKVWLELKKDGGLKKEILET